MYPTGGTHTIWELLKENIKVKSTDRQMQVKGEKSMAKAKESAEKVSHPNGLLKQLYAAKQLRGVF